MEEEQILIDLVGDEEEDLLAASNIPLFAFARGFSHVAFSFTARGQLRLLSAIRPGRGGEGSSADGTHAWQGVAISPQGGTR